MKKPLLGFLLLAPWLALAQEAIPFTVKGTVGQLNPPDKVYMLCDGDFIASASPINGVFEITGTVDTPRWAWLLLARDGKSVYTVGAERASLFLSQGTITVVSADSLHKTITTGPKPMMDYLELQASIGHAYNNHPPLPARPAADSLAAKQQQERRQAAIDKERKQLLRAYAQAHPTSFVSLDALQQADDLVPEYAESWPIYDALSPEVRNSPEGRKYGAMIQVARKASRSAPASAAYRVTAKLRGSAAGAAAPNDTAAARAIFQYKEAQGETDQKKARAATPGA